MIGAIEKLLWGTKLAVCKLNLPCGGILEGGFVLVENGKVISSLPLPIAGLMSDLPGEEVAKRLKELHDTAYERLGVSQEVEPVMTLCFMSLIVIPELKITTRGMFDVTKFDFVPPEVD